MRTMILDNKRTETENVNVQDILGLTLISIEKNDSPSMLTFRTSCNKTYIMYHEQDCCEDVSLEDICGDLKDLLGSPITLAEESSSSLTEQGEYPDDESSTWTFYKFATIKGYVDIRWCGTSNGYYSETVDFVKVV